MAKVMLVEDDNNLREIYEARLQAEGYTIVSARDGEEALVIAKKENPDLVISDVMMPKISGFEMLDILRNTDGLKDVKVIMLTALGQADDQQRANSLGADRYLVKSQVTLEDIIKVAHELLGDGTANPVETTSAATPAPAPSTDSTQDSPATASVATDTPAEIPSTPPADPPVTPAEPTDSPAAAVVVPEPVSSDSSVVVEPEPEAASSEDDTPSAEPLSEPATPTDTAALTSEATTDAESTGQEEAEVEAKIEDFVTGASTDASADAPVQSEPAASDATASTPAEPVATPPEPAPAESPTAETASDTQAANDKVMADAVNNLTTSAPTQNTAINASPGQTAADSSTIAHGKVIQPMDSEPKPDINDLAAVESANEAAAAPAEPPTAIIGDANTSQAAPLNITEPPADPNKPDPNAIAL